MVVADVRHLPVQVDGQVVGMLSARDCLAALSGAASATGPKVRRRPDRSPCPPAAARESVEATPDTRRRT